MVINWVEYLTPIVQLILTTAAAILAKVVYHFLQKFIAWIEEKFKGESYKNAVEVANGIYIALEDKYSAHFTKMGAVKKAEMKKLLLERFPNLTETELESINKTVWLAFNESWLEESAKRNELSSEV